MHDSIPTYRSFKARDGRELVVTANTEKMWQGLCRSLDLSELAGDARFATASDRLTNREELWQRSEEHTSELQSLMRISYAVFCLKTKKIILQTRRKQ